MRVSTACTVVTLGLALGCSSSRTRGDLPPSVVPRATAQAPVVEPEPESPRGPEPVQTPPEPLVEVEPPPEPEPELPSTASPGGPDMEIARRVRTGVQPKSVTFSPDGLRIYVCNFGYKGRHNVWVYDAQTLETLGEINFPGTAVEVAVSSDSQTLYISNFGRGVVAVVDAQTLRVDHEIKVGANPKVIVVDEARDTLYVSNWSSKTVSAVDLEAREVDHTLRTGRRPRGMAVLEDGTLFVGAMWDHRVQVYLPGRTRPQREWKPCEYPRHLMLSPEQDRLYVSCSGDRQVRWFDPRTDQKLGESRVGNNPRTIDLSRDGRFVAVADFSSSTVSLVDVVEMTYRTYDLPRTNQIVGVAVSPGEDLRVYATSWLTNELLELRPRVVTARS